MNSENNLNEYSVSENPNTVLKHSGLGIASFVIGITSIILAVVMIILLSVSVADLFMEGSPEPTEEEIMEFASSQSLFLVSGIVLVILFFSQVIGGIIGIISLFQKNRKKLFPILGTIFNLLPLLAAIGFIVFSFAVGISAGATSFS
ncbi:hypothetical protein [Chengkuizengella axinellae]|uniref:DUF4064 domain-containing protein n=1 Tax=Chengkuizengella axinellae TaxID=3064388 RepID=A0ABT9J0L7_9BACL|nr:hypothetical protein [Chengkuizengella sp. 2205SS18-9]MDP5275118.1 hypothetical protein [Chengkuizengella sp. 2205SS18-9]